MALPIRDARCMGSVARVSWILCVAAVSVDLTQPAWCAAQDRGPVAPMIHLGLLNPAGVLDNASILTSGYVVSYADVGSVPTLSASIDLFGGRALGLRLAAGASLRRLLTGTWGCAPDASGEPVPCPAILIRVPTDLGLMLGNVDLVGPELGHPEVIALRPLGGLVVVRSSLEWDPAEQGSFSLEPGTASFVSAGVRFGIILAHVAGPARFEAAAGGLLARVVEETRGPQYSSFVQIGVCWAR